jgi:hypothetical protein
MKVVEYAQDPVALSELQVMEIVCLALHGTSSSAFLSVFFVQYNLRKIF